MNHVGEVFFRKDKGTNIASDQVNRGMPSEMRRFGPKRLGRTGQHGHDGGQLQLIARESKAFQQPAAEKTGAASDENARVTQLVPESGRVFQDVPQVARERMIHRVCYNTAMVEESTGTS